jgi:hypothetical protein
MCVRPNFLMSIFEKIISNKLFFRGLAHLWKRHKITKLILGPFILGVNYYILKNIYFCKSDEFLSNKHVIHWKNTVYQIVFEKMKKFKFLKVIFFMCYTLYLWPNHVILMNSQNSPLLYLLQLKIFFLFHLFVKLNCPKS